MALQAIDSHFALTPPFGIVGSESDSLSKAAVREFLPVRFDDHVGVRHAFHVEPPVGAGNYFENEPFTLEIVFADIDIEAVAGAEVKRVRLDFLRMFLSRRVPASHILEGSKFLLNFNEVVLLGHELQGSQNGGEACFSLYGLFELLIDCKLGAS